MRTEFASQLGTKFAEDFNVISEGGITAQKVTSYLDSLVNRKRITSQKAKQLSKKLLRLINSHKS